MTDYIKFTLDGSELGTVRPPANGFWEMGGFPSNFNNPWRFGTKMAPFDEEVESADFYFCLILN